MKLTASHASTAGRYFGRFGVICFPFPSFSLLLAGSRFFLQRIVLIQSSHIPSTNSSNTRFRAPPGPAFSQTPTSHLLLSLSVCVYSLLVCYLSLFVYINPISLARCAVTKIFAWKTTIVARLISSTRGLSRPTGMEEKAWMRTKRTGTGVTNHDEGSDAVLREDSASFHTNIVTRFCCVGPHLEQVLRRKTDDRTICKNSSHQRDEDCS